ncbi:MAG TPA: antitoxin family protein [Phycisphaerae bacterium]|nr:antitoxin family protein [Phycisphaerae bacterium]
MTQMIDAIYEDGVLKPITPLTGIREHQHVRLAIESDKSPHPLLKHCGTLPDEDAREIKKIIEEEFEKVDPNDWK